MGPRRPTGSRVHASPPAAASRFRADYKSRKATRARHRLAARRAARWEMCPRSAAFCGELQRSGLAFPACPAAAPHREAAAPLPAPSSCLHAGPGSGRRRGARGAPLRRPHPAPGLFTVPTSRWAGTGQRRYRCEWRASTGAERGTYSGWRGS